MQEYLLALLDVMTRSTDQLVVIFNKLSTPVSPPVQFGHINIHISVLLQKFAMSRLDLSKAPVPLDPAVVHTLHSQLHTFKKCFTGKDFVEQFLKLGREAEAGRQSSSEPTTPSPRLPTFQRSPVIGGHFNSSATGPRIVYTVQYAKDVGKFLLAEKILLPLPGPWQGFGDSEGEEEEGEEEEEEGLVDRHQRSSSIQSDQLGRPAEGDRARADAAKDTPPSSVENSPRLQPSKRRRPPFNYHTGLQDSGSTVPLTAKFVYSPQSLYKFADVEDFESHALYHSQILSASAHPQAVDGLEETTAFERARMGMLFLVQDLLLQRGRREKRVKQFLQTPPALSVAERRKHQYVECNLIFKL